MGQNGVLRPSADDFCSDTGEPSSEESILSGIKSQRLDELISEDERGIRVCEELRCGDTSLREHNVSIEGVEATLVAGAEEVLS